MTSAPAEDDEALAAKVARLEREKADLEARLASLPMPLSSYRRYGRQMILEGFGLSGQLSLSRASLLVVGAGGLGCPALLYLAGAGVGSITVVDHDTVDLSNLHRQVLHTEARIGLPKVESARSALLERNSSIKIRAICAPFTSLLADELGLPSFDAVLDCTDNAPTRYLLNDLCVRADVPLISGAAIRTDGQVAIWNLPLADSKERGPCYRCIFPAPEAAAPSERCEDEGVLGPVTGTIGTLMATEVIKLLTGLHDRQPTLLLYAPLGPTPFRRLKIRSKRSDCIGCGVGKREAPISVLEQSCAVTPSTADIRLGPREAKALMGRGNVRVVDTRKPTEFGICAIPGSINRPLDELLAHTNDLNTNEEVLVVCKHGNDSLIAARALRGAGIKAVDMIGGLQRYAEVCDPAFPIY